MASTGNLSTGSWAGHTTLPGLRVSQGGASINDIKVYSFAVTSTVQVSATSTAVSYTGSGLRTADIPLALVPSTSAALQLSPGAMFVRAANTLDVTWNTVGTSTAGIPGLAAPGAAYTLITMSYQDQSSSTTT